MPILEDFCKEGKKPIGKIIDGPSGNFHWVWPSQAGEAGNDWDASTNEQVLADYEKHGEKMVKLGITGTMVANDWDVCVADVHVSKHVLYKSFSGIELTRISQVSMQLMILQTGKAKEQLKKKNV